MGGVCAAHPDAVVWASDAGSREEAAAWAERLALPLTSTDGPDLGVVLEVGPEGLALRLGQGPRVTAASRALARRRVGGRDLLLRAVGRLEEGAVVVDATAGLGADAFHLAVNGVRVHMIERHPLVAALLQDVLWRTGAGHEGEDARQAAARLSLSVGDARFLLGGIDPAPSVVLLDPMYPDAGKRALPNKGMALFRALVGTDADADEMLQAALRVALKRVVVKRPRRGALLGAGAPAPSGSVVGTTTRYDLYAPIRPGT
jgi:16S rRNA (guanine1516-N2)-methyltransferase